VVVFPAPMPYTMAAGTIVVTLGPKGIVVVISVVSIPEVRTIIIWEKPAPSVCIANPVGLDLDMG
jgi:hypothetical protein